VIAEEQLEAEKPLENPVKTGLFGSTFASLAHHDFAWFFASSFAFFMAMQMQMLLFGYLTFDLTDSAKALGIVSSAFALPTLFAAPFSGVLADRINKRTILAVTQTGSFSASAVIAVLIWTDVVALWHLILVSLFLGVLLSLNMPTRQATVPQLVPRHRLMNAISLQMAEMNLSRIVAPALAGVLVAPLGIGWVFAVTASLFFIATASQFKLPHHGMVGHESRNAFLSEIKEGMRYIAHHETVRLLIAASIMIPLLAFPVQMMLPIFAREVFDRGASGLGFLAAAAGVGGLIGAIISANMDRVAHKGRLLLVGGVTASLLYAAFALSPVFELALVLIAAASVGQMVFMTTNNTVIQATVPPELRGRVVSLVMMSIGLAPLGLVPTTIAADAFGAPATVAVTSMIMLGILLTMFWLSPRLRGLRLDALARAEMSPAQAAALVAEGKISQDEADRLAGASRA
jgi:MFS family permease